MLPALANPFAIRLETLLGDARFVERAPAAVVQRERDRLAELRTQLAALTGAST